MTLLVLLRGSTSLLPATKNEGPRAGSKLSKLLLCVESCDTRRWKGIEGIVPPILNDRDEGRGWPSRGRSSVQLLMDDGSGANCCDLSCLDLPLFTRQIYIFVCILCQV